MAVVQVTGSIVSGPQVATNVFPSSVLTIALATTPDPKPQQVEDSGVRQINSPSSYVTVGSIGASESVQQGTFLYVRTSAPVFVKKTIFQSPGPDLETIDRVHGLHICEFPAGEYLKLLEVQGSAQVEYYVCGPQ